MLNVHVAGIEAAAIPIHAVPVVGVMGIAEGFEADASFETLERTTLGALAVGSRLNVERALAVGFLLAERIIRASSGRSRIRFVPYTEAFGKGFEDPPRRVPDISRAKQLLGWQPEVDLDEGLRRTLAWWHA
mgnify:CR=1 FL=1